MLNFLCCLNFLFEFFSYVLEKRKKYQNNKFSAEIHYGYNTIIFS